MIFLLEKIEMSLCKSELVVLMLPGFGCDADSMLELNVVLKGNQCIKHVIHMLFAAETSLDDMVRTIENKYKHSELLLVGFSMGGWVAQAVASKLRSNVKGMILISSWTEAPSQYLKIIKSLHEKIKSGDTLDSLRPLVVEGFIDKQTKDAMADRWVSMANRIGPEMFLRQTKAILEDPNVGQCIPNIECPTLAIAGAADTLLTPDEQFKSLLDPAIFQTVTLESCGHNLIWERPLMVSSFVEQWLHLNFESKD